MIKRNGGKEKILITGYGERKISGESRGKLDCTSKEDKGRR